MGFLGDMTGDFSWSNFEQARRNYFQKSTTTLHFPSLLVDALAPGPSQLIFVSLGQQHTSL